MIEKCRKCVCCGKVFVSIYKIQKTCGDKTCKHLNAKFRRKMNYKHEPKEREDSLEKKYYNKWKKGGEDLI